MSHQASTAALSEGDNEALPSESRLVDGLLEQVDLLHVVLDPQGRVVRFNRTCQETTGYAADEVIHQFLWRLPFLSQEAERARRRFQSLCARRSPSRHEENWRARDGSLRRIAWSTVPILNDAGRIRLVLCTGTDMTPLAQARRDLRNERHALRDRVRKLNCLYAISNVVAKAALSLDEILQGIVDAIPSAWPHPELTCARIWWMGRAIATSNFAGTNWRLAREIVVRDRTVGKLEVCHLREKPQRDEEPFVNEERALIDAVAERIGKIIERKQAEEKLAFSERLYRTIFETTGTATVIIDADTTILLANAEFERLSGYAKCELEGRMSYTRLVADEDLARVHARHRLRRIDADSAPSKYECRLITRDGGVRDTFLTIDMIPGTKRSVGSFLDITEHNRTEAHARQRIAELAHVSRLSTAGEMASGLAHELNQPLFAVVNFAEGCIQRVRSGEVNPGELQGALEDIVKEAERAGKIIHRLRNFVRKRRPEFQDVDLNDVVREAVTFAEIGARMNQIPVHLDLVSEDLIVQADGIQLQQVILNLIRNGFEAMAGPERPERGLVVRTARLEDGMAEVAVIDHGQGLCPAASDCVFDPFVTSKSDGMGIGLSISRTIVEAHQGRLWATPNADGGTTFRFVVPVVRGTSDDDA